MWLEYANVIALIQEGFDMIKMTNICNHCDVNKKLCNTHLFFIMVPSFFERWHRIEVIFFN